MSHFTVMVIGEQPGEQLAPFQENNMGSTPEKFLVFEDNEKQYRKEYEKGLTTRILMPNGELKSPYDDMFKWVRKGSFLDEKYDYPPVCKKKRVPFKKIYATFEEFMEDWHGTKCPDEKTGRYGHWYNPSAKWDWYALGGRWTGFFRMKPTALNRALTGKPGLMTEEAKAGTADSALKEDIDFEWIRETKMEEAGRDWDAVHAVIKGRPVVSWQALQKTWGFKLRVFVSEVINQISLKLFDTRPLDEYTKIRKAYWNQQVIKDLVDARTPAGVSFDGPDRFLMPRKDYVAQAGRRAFSTFAVIKDGKWFEKGSMGWWGMVSDEKDESIWLEEFDKMLNSLPGDTLLSVYDCHI